MDKWKALCSLFKARNLKVKMLVAFIPPLILTLVTTGYLTYRVSNNFILVALEKASRIHVASVSQEMEHFLERCRTDLAVIAQETASHANLGKYLATLRSTGRIDYRILAFVSQQSDRHIVHVAFGDTVQQVPPEKLEKIEPSLMTFYEQIRGMGGAETWISKIRKVEYPFPLSENPNHVVSSSAVFFARGHVYLEGTKEGYLLIGVDVANLREIVSSSHHRLQEGLWGTEENAEVRYSYFFDTSGWIHFDSGSPKESHSEISTELARFGLEGILGTPELSASFKPDAVFQNFWNMVDQVKAGDKGITKTANLAIQSPSYREHLCTYAPVFFQSQEQGPPMVYGGVAFVDRSRLTEASVSQQIDIVFLITMAAIVLVSVVIFFLAHVITKPLLALTEAVDSLQQVGNLEPLEVPGAGYEIALLKNSINNMISRIKEQRSQIESGERMRQIEALRTTPTIEEQDKAISGPAPDWDIAGLIGNNPKIAALRSEIQKAAKVDMDVLIQGETGTGKQLAAEAIHRHSARSGGPLVTINCGELDEHLLLDALFGHLRGAYTEAKTARKGAFVEANGGTVFLDEIQAASSAVQQALLRVISQRKIKPLGSDTDLQVNVRVIAATNADLKELVDQGKFRQDVYFRLKVITIHTPSLREMREDIPELVRHYFLEAKRLTQKNKLAMSQGALEKLTRYDWPGNVRELMNCITRSVVMTESPMIQAEDLILESDEEGTTPMESAFLRGAPGNKDRFERESDHGVDFPETSPPLADVSLLTSRQRKAYRYVVENGSITRLEYQALVGGNLPSRTAIYDLHTLVAKGVLKKEGKGPATRYLLDRSISSNPHLNSDEA
jgi:DNA-binding NtrC family response regulator/HAMP domain-containing protein